MALVLGTNCGFVSAAPTADPSAPSVATADGRTNAIRDTVPQGVTAITEIGWWRAGTATGDANWEAGLYTNNSQYGSPDYLINGDYSNAAGTATGVWVRCSGLNIPVTPGNLVWIAVQMDAVTGAASIAYNAAASSGRTAIVSGQTALLSTFPASSPTDNTLLGIYALYGGGGGGSIIAPKLNSYRMRRN